jgi:hypothetical protein
VLLNKNEFPKSSVCMSHASRCVYRTSLQFTYCVLVYIFLVCLAKSGNGGKSFGLEGILWFLKVTRPSSRTARRSDNTAHHLLLPMCAPPLPVLFFLPVASRFILSTAPALSAQTRVAPTLRHVSVRGNAVTMLQCKSFMLSSGRRSMYKSFVLHPFLYTAPARAPQHRAIDALHNARCVTSKRHFTVSKNAAETLIQLGQRLYGEQWYCRDAAKSWGQAALLQHAPSHAFLSSLHFDGRANVPKDEQRAFECAIGGWGGVGLRLQQGRSRPRRWCC